MVYYYYCYYYLHLSIYCFVLFALIERVLVCGVGKLLHAAYVIRLEDLCVHRTMLLTPQAPVPR